MGMAELGGPLAHQLPLHNHRGGLVQPSLVMNHHLDMDCHGVSGGGGGGGPGGIGGVGTGGGPVEMHQSEYARKSILHSTRQFDILIYTQIGVKMRLK